MGKSGRLGLHPFTPVCCQARLPFLAPETRKKNGTPIRMCLLWIQARIVLSVCLTPQKKNTLVMAGKALQPRQHHEERLLSEEDNVNTEGYTAPCDLSEFVSVLTAAGHRRSSGFWQQNRVLSSRQGRIFSTRQFSVGIVSTPGPLYIVKRHRGQGRMPYYAH